MVTPGSIVTLTLQVRSGADNAHPGKGYVFCLHEKGGLFPSTFAGGSETPICVPREWLQDTRQRRSTGRS